MTKTLVLSLALCLVSGLAVAQVPVPDSKASEQATLEEYLKMVRGDLEARRDSALDALLEMNDTERRAFTPLKQAYDKELSAIGKRRLEAMNDYMSVHTKLTTDKAKELFDRFQKLDEDRTTLRKKYFELMSKQVSPIVAVQFLQLQRQFETMGDLKVVTRMPLAMQ